MFGHDMEEGFAFGLESTNFEMPVDERFSYIKDALESLRSEAREQSTDAFRMLLNVDDYNSPSKVVRETLIHSMSTAIYAAILVEEDSISPQQKESIIQAALFHDVGKDSVDKEVLFKPGSLNREEFEKVKEHTAYGPIILSGFNNIRPEIPIASLYHHYSTKNYGFNEKIDFVLPEYLRNYVDGNEFQRHVVDIVSISDSLSAVVDNRTYSEGGLHRLPGIVNELYNMCDGVKYKRRCQKNIAHLSQVLNVKLEQPENRIITNDSK